MSVRFRAHTVHSKTPPQTVEEAAKVYSSWARIHRNKFRDHFSSSQVTISDPTGWGVHWIEESCPPEMVIEYEMLDPDVRHGVVFQLRDAEETPTYTIMMVMKATDEQSPMDSIYGLIKESNSSSPDFTSDEAERIRFIPMEGVATGRFKFAYREQRFSEDKSYIIQSLGLWVNDMEVFTFSQRRDTETTMDLRVGLTSRVTRTFHNVRIPQLTELVEWASLDPGEPPAGGLGRMLEGRYVKFFIRADGSLAMWRPYESEPQKVFSDDEIELIASRFDKRGLYTHVRMLGAYEESEYHRIDLTERYGHRFAEVNNPFLMTQHACQQEAIREIRRMESSALDETIKTPVTPELEIEDVIETPKGLRHLTARSFEFKQGKIEQQLSLRGYEGGV